MNHNESVPENPYEMKFDIGTIKHLGLQMYSTLPPVIGELVANAWDANATKVEITIPEEQINQQNSELIICDNGIGMSDEDVRSKYLIIGRDRRDIEQSDKTPLPHARKVMGRKGIGKFSAFGIAKEIVVESVKESNVSHFRMNYDELLKRQMRGLLNCHGYILQKLFLKAQKSHSSNSLNSEIDAFLSGQFVGGLPDDSLLLGR